MALSREAYLSKISDEERALVALISRCCRKTPAKRYVIRGGCAWRLMPRDLWSWRRYPARATLASFGLLCPSCQRTACRSANGSRASVCGERGGARQLCAVRHAQEWASPSHNRHKRKHGSKLHVAVDMLGHLLALHIAAASAISRVRRSRKVYAATGDSVEPVFSLPS